MSWWILNNFVLFCYRERKEREIYLETIKKEAEQKKQQAERIDRRLVYKNCFFFNSNYWCQNYNFQIKSSSNPFVVFIFFKQTNLDSKTVDAARRKYKRNDWSGTRKDQLIRRSIRKNKRRNWCQFDERIYISLHKLICKFINSL